MTKYQLLLIIPIILLFSCTTTDRQVNSDSGNNITLTTQWTLTGFSAPESVLYDDTRDILYVSNVNGENSGFISRISTTGEMLDKNWVTGLNGPKGMTLDGDMLYVSDVNKLTAIDVKSGTITATYDAPEAEFLNDVIHDEHHNVYVSDMLTDTIYRLEEGSFGPWLTDANLKFPNGLTIKDETLYVASWGTMNKSWETLEPGNLKAVSLQNKEITVLGNKEPIGNLDGLEIAVNGTFFVTDYVAGKLFIMSQNGEVLDTIRLSQGTADLEHVENNKWLIIPYMNDNKIVMFTY